ncbi:Uma2 family endonuclease [Prosthecodimorpha hirschii]|uniref:Uma2 family endonuclease n=1 Tax=Prosthecodimorpha hirschii TaxID=665126 RepID=UPI001FEE6BEA|nr:Uma2 family endonuclease [Prosthecomicrobium hirschii]
MASAIPKYETMSFDDFEELLLDKPDNERWELIGGRVIRGMVGARWEHHIIAQNLMVALRSHIKATGRPCRVFQETFFLKRRELDFAVLPDVMVRCGPMEPASASVPDPMVVIEVLSPGTEPRDRYDKWDGYRQIPSLQHYVLVHRDRILVEIKTRQGTEWTTTVVDDPAAEFALAALDFRMPLAAVYEDVLAG